MKNCGGSHRLVKFRMWGVVFFAFMEEEIIRGAMVGWKKPDSMRCSDLIPCVWLTESQRAIYRALGWNEKGTCLQCSYLLTLVTGFGDMLGGFMTFLKIVGAIHPFFPPVITIATAAICYPVARCLVFDKYHIESPVPYELMNMCFCCIPCGLAQLRGQLGESGGGGATATAFGGLFSAKPTVQEVNDDLPDFEDEDEHRTFIQRELKNSRAHYAIGDLKATTHQGSSTDGGDNAYDRVGYATGWPSGFPQQWFDQYYCYDKRQAAAQMVDEIGAAVTASKASSIGDRTTHSMI